MARKRSRSAGVRHPARNALLFAAASLIAWGLVAFGIADAREAGGSGSPWLMIGGLPALFCPMLAVYYASRIRVFRDLRSGRTAIARWTVPPDEFADFRAHEAGIGKGSVDVNFYRLPAKIPDPGLEVIFSDRGVLIDGGWFPLSFTGGRRVLAIDYQADPPAIAFTTRLTTAVQTSSTTYATRHHVSMLRVPVARAARGQVDALLERFRAQLAAG
ncbi:hypothetical protein [Arenimonas sp. MALMAid1274]|uniref:hypothetical protein n=1 Tax=Arenimonas sp. MALMAid1274 TaxID=3411630 RepID=UPI003B9EBC85